MITVKDAIKAAQDWAREIYPEKDLKHLRLEEVEFSEDTRAWNITLGWLEPAIRSNGFALAGINGQIQKLPRVYKTFKVDAENGTVRAMKIREVDE